ncbi:MAG: oligosaccharide flippase family protein [bacterium]|nr:oligosaccharide flippase family protein [bacterium]
MIKKSIALVREDTFLKNNVIFFLGSIVIAFLNYLYHPIMSRLLTVEEFGEVQTIFSLVFLSGVVMTVFNRIVLHIASNSEHDGLPGERALISNAASIPGLYTAALAVQLPFVFFLVIASPAISRFFAFETSWSFSVFAVALLLTVPATFYGAYLQGKSEFMALSLSQAISAGGKLALAILLVVLGMGVFGAIGALAIASFIAILYMRSRSKGFALSLVSFKQMVYAIKKEISYGILILLSLGLVTFLYSADVLVIKRLFSPEVAGMYSGVATIARIIFFGTASVGAVLLSSIKIHNTAEQNRTILKKGFLYVGVLGGGAFLIFALFPAQIITLLIGAKYAPLAYLLPLFSLSSLLVSFLSLFVTYLLALRSRALIPVSVVGFIAVFVLIATNHSTPGTIVFDFAASTAFTLVLLASSLHFFKKSI